MPLFFGLLQACSSAAPPGSGQAGNAANVGASGGSTAGNANGGGANGGAPSGGAANGGAASAAGAAEDPDVGTSGPVVVNNLALGDDFNAVSDGALTRLGALYNSSIGQWTTGPRWSWANDVESSLANYERANGELAPYLFSETYDLNLSKNFLDDFGYDDEAWWANAWIRAFDDTGDTKYLMMAKTIFADMINAWDASTCNGGVWWNRDRAYKNAITNELFMLVAAQLHNRTPSDENYLNWATQEWTWFFTPGGMVSDQGLINDGLTSDCKNNAQTTWTYNQGIVLGAAVELFNATGADSYLKEAQKLADASTTRLITSGGILQEPCEPNASCNDDQSNFKGIYQRHLLRLYDAETTPAYGAFLFKNAHSVANNDRDATNSLGNMWAGPFDSSDAQRQNSGLQALHAAAPPWTKNLPFLRASGGASFNHAMGRPIAPLAWRCDPASCPSAGSMQDGPFIAYLPAGAHVAHFGLAASRISSASTPLAELEVRDETAGSAIATRAIPWSAFDVARATQDFAIPFTQQDSSHALSFRVLWQALSGAPALTVSDVSIDRGFATSAANMTHECGRLDAFQNWEADRFRDAASCELAAAAAVTLPAGHASAHFELKVDNFNLDGARVATIAVLDHGSLATVVTKDLARSDFRTLLYRDFALEFTAESGHSYDFVTTWQDSALAPRLTERGVYVVAATEDASISLPFDTRGVGSVFASQWLGSALTVSGHAFTFGSSASGAMNVLSANGQSISLPSKPASAIHLVLFAVNGTQPNQTFTVHYSDDSNAAIARSVSDWVSASPGADEAYAVAAPARWSKTGLEYGNFHIFVHTLPLDSTRTPTALSLPMNPNLKIFAATLSEIAE